MTYLEIEKVNYLLLQSYNIFHADLICRAIQDNDLSFDTFRNGINEIRKAEKEDKDEYIPKGWEEI